MAATYTGNTRGGQIFRTGPDWKIMEYEFKEYKPHNYDIHEYKTVNPPMRAHEYGRGHSYNALHEWKKIRTYEPNQYNPRFYRPPKRERPPPQAPPPLPFSTKPRPSSRDYRWAKLHKCYEEPIGPEFKTRRHSLHEYRDKEYHPAMTEYKGDKVQYIDRQWQPYSGSVHYDLTKKNFYPFIERKKVPPKEKRTGEKDLNDNVVKEKSATSLKGVTLEEKSVFKPKSAKKKPVEEKSATEEKSKDKVEEKTKSPEVVNREENVAVLAAGAVMVNEKEKTAINDEDTMTIADTSWDKEEEKKTVTPAPVMVMKREDSKHTVTTSHVTQTTDRLTPVDNVRSESITRKDRTPSPVQQHTVMPLPVVAGGAAVIATQKARTSPTPSPSPSVSIPSAKSPSRGSSRHRRSHSSHSVASPNGLVIAGAIMAAETRSNNNPPPVQQNPTQTTEENKKSPTPVSEGQKKKPPSPPPAVPVAAVAGNIQSDPGPKQRSPSPKVETPKKEESPPSPKQPSPTQSSVIPVVPIAAAVSANKSDPDKVPIPPKPSAKEDKDEKEKEASAPVVSSNTKSGLPPEVVAAIEAYNAAHEKNQVNTPEAGLPLSRIPPEVSAAIEAYDAVRTLSK